MLTDRDAISDRLSAAAAVLSVRLLCAIAGCTALLLPVAAADEDDEQQDTAVPIVRLHTERQVSRNWDLLLESLESGRTEESEELLQRLAGEDPLLMVRLPADTAEELRLRPASGVDDADAVPEPDSEFGRNQHRVTRFVPLFRAAFDAGQRLPSAVRRRWKERWESVASSRLKRIVRDGDLPECCRLILRYPMTDAAARAHLIAAQIHLSRGSGIAAAAWAAPLDNAAVSNSIRKAARSVLNAAAEINISIVDPDSSLQSQSQSQAPTVAAESVTAEPNAEDDRASDKDREPALSARRGSEKVTRLDAWWESSALPGTPVEAGLRTLNDSLRSSGFTTDHSWNAVVEDGVVYRRSHRGLSATQLQTGEELWHLPVNASQYDQLTDLSGDPSGRRLMRIRARIAGVSDDAQAGTLIDLLIRDSLQTRVTFGDDRLFVVVPNPQLINPLSSMTARALLLRQPVPFHPGSLTAVDRKSGQLIWQTNSDIIRDPKGTPVVPWICGPPAVTPDGLVCLVDSDSQLFLVRINPRTGESVDQIRVLTTDTDVSTDSVRRLRGVTPADAGGLLVTQTGCEWLVAVDPLTRATMWARMIPTDEGRGSVPRLPGVGGRGAMTTRESVLQKSWRRPVTHRAGRNLLMLPMERPELQIIDAVTGRLVRYAETGPGVSVLFAAESDVVFSDGRILHRLSVPEARCLWSVAFPTDKSLRAGGTAARQGSMLLTARSDGSLEWRSWHTGKVLGDAGAPGFTGTPNLYAADNGGFVAVLPDSTVLLHAEAASATHRSAVERAALLIESARAQFPTPAAESDPLEQALRILQGEPARSISEDARRRRLLFRLALQMAAIRHPLSEEAAQQLSAETPREQQLLTALRIQGRQLTPGNCDQEITELVGLINQTESVADSFMSESGESTEVSSPRTADTLTVRRTVRGWATERLARAVDVRSQSASDLPDSLLQLGSDVLMQLDTASIHELLLSRARDNGSDVSDEERVHLLLHAIHLSRMPFGPRPAERLREAAAAIAEFTQRLTIDRESSESVTEHATTTLHPDDAAILMAVVLSELPADAAEAVQTAFRDAGVQAVHVSRPALDEEYRRRRMMQWSQWQADRLTVFPLSREMNTNSPQSVHLPAGIPDRFLRMHRMQLTRSGNRLLLERTDIRPTRSRSVPGTFDVEHSSGVRTASAFRAGTVILLQTTEMLAGVSLLDGRMLWRIDLEDSSSSVGRMPRVPRPFRDSPFDASAPPDDSLPESSEVLGAGPGWVLFRKAGESPAMLNPLTGRVVWSLSGTHPADNLIAADHGCLLVRRGSAAGNGSPEPPVRRLNRLNGNPLSAGEAADFRQLLAATPDGLIFWKERNDTAGTPAQLMITDESGSEITGTILLSDYRMFQRPASDVLTAFGADGQAGLIHLSEGTLQRVQFQHLKFDSGAGADRTGEAASKGSEAGRFSLLTDGVSMYALEHSDGSSSELAVLLLKKELSVQVSAVESADIGTGASSWFLRFSDPMHLTTRHTGTAVWTAVRSHRQEGLGADSVIQHHFRGIRRRDGAVVFDEALPTRYQFRKLEISESGPDRLQADMTGLQVRFSVAEP